MVGYKTMSKLDDILLEAAMRHEEQRAASPVKLSEHIKPTKADIKAFMVELIGEEFSTTNQNTVYVAHTDPAIKARVELRAELRKKVEGL